MVKIIDISHHQPPSAINYDKLSKEVDLVIVRTQYGSSTIDRHYKTHHKEFNRRGVPTNAYAWVRGVSIADMEKEATDFYNRTKEFKPAVYWLDVEEKSMSDMRAGVKAYAKKLRSLGAKKVGAYIANHLYKSLNLDTSDFDAIWIPSYGRNTGKQSESRKPDFPCDLWQFTDKGRLNGYNGNLDLNAIISNKSIGFFTGAEGAVKASSPVKVSSPTKQATKTYKVIKSIPAYKNAIDAKNKSNKAGTVKSGTYSVFNESNGMVNVTTKAGTPGSWINPSENKASATSKPVAKKTIYTVKKGDVLSKIAAKYNTTTKKLQEANNIKDANKIYPGQKIKIK